MRCVRTCSIRGCLATAFCTFFWFCFSLAVFVYCSYLSAMPFFCVLKIRVSTALWCDPHIVLVRGLIFVFDVLSIAELFICSEAVFSVLRPDQGRLGETTAPQTIFGWLIHLRLLWQSCGHKIAAVLRVPFLFGFWPSHGESRSQYLFRNYFRGNVGTAKSVDVSAKFSKSRWITISRREQRWLRGESTL